MNKLSYLLYFSIQRQTRILLGNSNQGRWSITRNIYVTNNLLLGREAGHYILSTTLLLHISNRLKSQQLFEFLELDNENIRALYVS
jgi:hypothetical protein